MKGDEDASRIRLDIVAGDRSASDSTFKGRPFLMVYFRCSNRYTRVYRNRKGDSYVAQCPTCGKSMRFTVGPGGTTERLFELSC